MQIKLESYLFRIFFDTKNISPFHDQLSSTGKHKLKSGFCGREQEQVNSRRTASDQEERQTAEDVKKPRVDEKNKAYPPTDSRNTEYYGIFAC